MEMQIDNGNDYGLTNDRLKSTISSNVILIGKGLVQQGLRVFAPKTTLAEFIIVFNEATKQKTTLLFSNVSYKWAVNTPKNVLDTSIDASIQELTSVFKTHLDKSFATNNSFDTELQIISKICRELK